jgi:putative alpha-1,2-mannosidase
MEERVELFGGKEAFAGALDSFFGFNGESIKPMRHLDAYKDIAATSHHRFEGFNNECDMETPYAYIYADRHDRLCEIIHECVSRSFGLGKGGLPGNNDSGGLSSTFVWNTLGIFPVSGSGEFLIGAPQMEGAEITLSSGKRLCIRVNRESKAQIYVDRVCFNAREINGYRLSVQEVMQGGVLEFWMK